MAGVFRSHFGSWAVWLGHHCQTRAGRLWPSWLPRLSRAGRSRSGAGAKDVQGSALPLAIETPGATLESNTGERSDGVCEPERIGRLRHARGDERPRAPAWRAAGRGAAAGRRGQGVRERAGLRAGLLLEQQVHLLLVLRDAPRGHGELRLGVLRRGPRAGGLGLEVINDNNNNNNNTYN